MIPHFSDLSRESVARVQVPPPPRFRPLSDVPEAVRCRQTVRVPSKGLTAAQQSGLRYEAKAQLYLRDVLGKQYVVAPHLTFLDGADIRTCIPDGIYFGEDGLAVVFEIKSQHCPEAWWQLRKLYQPVVERLSYVSRVGVCEVTKSFDPLMPFPEEPRLVAIKDITSRLEPSFAVLVWRP